MRRIACVLAAVVVSLSALGGVASANNGGGGTYPPKPVKIITEKPVVPYGSGFWAKAYGLCPGVPAIFTIQSLTDLNDYREFYGAELPGTDPSSPYYGSTSYVFTPEMLAGFVGPIRVGVYQSSGDCQVGASTIVNIQKDKPPVKTPTVTAPPTVNVGDTITAEAKNLCQGTVIFAIQSVDDWTVRWFSDPVKVNADGTATFTFPKGVLPAASAYTVYAKQPDCNVVATTLVKVKKKTETAGSTTNSSGTTSTPETASAAVAVPTSGPAAATAATTITPQVLSAGITAPTAASSSARPAGSASAATARQVGSGTLPVTGSEPSHTLQIALTALVAGLGMILVSSVRRRTANVRSR